MISWIFTISSFETPTIGNGEGGWMGNCGDAIGLFGDPIIGEPGVRGRIFGSPRIGEVALELEGDLVDIVNVMNKYVSPKKIYT